MVMQAKLERRRRRHGDGVDRTDSATPSRDPQNIPPPSEPAPPAESKTTNGPAMTPVANGVNGGQDGPVQGTEVPSDKAEGKPYPATQKGDTSRWY